MRQTAKTVLLQPLRPAVPFLLAGMLCAVATPATAWTRQTQLTIAREAARLAPPDLARQLEKHQDQFERGVLAPFADTDADRHQRNADGSGLLDQVIAAEVAQAIEMIETHRPFAEIVWRLGVISHYAAEANNPLAAADEDRAESRYAHDYARYVESILPRCPLIFYGNPTDLLDPRGAERLVDRALARSRKLYPTLASEYQRIEYGSGRLNFDDRSTAFGLSSISFSRAVNDVLLLMRHIWIRAGGADPRGLPSEGRRRIRLPRHAPSR